MAPVELWSKHEETYVVNNSGLVVDPEMPILEIEYHGSKPIILTPAKLSPILAAKLLPPDSRDLWLDIYGVRPTELSAISFVDNLFSGQFEVRPSKIEASRGRRIKAIGNNRGYFLAIENLYPGTKLTCGDDLTDNTHLDRGFGAIWHYNGQEKRVKQLLYAQYVSFNDLRYGVIPACDPEDERNTGILLASANAIVDPAALAEIKRWVYPI